LGNLTPIIPAPARLRPAVGEFRLISGAAIAYRDPILAPQARRFARDAAQRCGIALDLGTGERAPAIVIDLGDDPGFAGLPAPLGLDPAGSPRDERYALTVDRSGIRLRAREPAGVARGLTSLLQLIATATATATATTTATATATTTATAAATASAAATATATAVPLPALDILDAPRFAWRGLTVDVVRRFFPPALVTYAADRFVTLLPEIDTPGHGLALLRLRPELGSGRNLVRPGQPHQSAWLDPELPATFEVLDAALAELAGLFPGPFLHIGGDEPYGMPDQAYGVYVRRLKQAARALGKRTVGWQESIRAGADPAHVIQYWMDASSLGVGSEAPAPPEVAARVTVNYRRARTDLEQALAHGVPVIVSPQAHCYLDVPYAEAPADPGQRERRDHVGLRSYARKTLANTFDWDPVAVLGPAARPDHVAGVGAALWCETVRDIDDLTFLLLPRLAGTAEKAWGAAGAVRWPEHRDALARHERLWAQDGLTFFSAART
jgi:hexosaminidase